MASLSEARCSLWLTLSWSLLQHTAHPALEAPHASHEEELADSALRLQQAGHGARSPLGSEPVTSRASLNALPPAVNSSGSASVVVNLPSSYDAASELDNAAMSPSAGPSAQDQHQVRISSL